MLVQSDARPIEANVAWARQLEHVRRQLHVRHHANVDAERRLGFGKLGCVSVEGLDDGARAELRLNEDLPVLVADVGVAFEEVARVQHVARVVAVAAAHHGVSAFLVEEELPFALG